MSDTLLRVQIGEQLVGPNALSLVESVRISDKSGTSTDTATVTFDDSLGLVAMPEDRAPIKIWMGPNIFSYSLMFSGFVQRSKSEGGRSSGRKLVVSCAGVDVASKAREPQRLHFDDMTVEQILRKAGSKAGVEDYRIAERFKSLVLDYEAMDNEDFITFGQRLAKELGATFKFRNDTAVFAERNEGVAPSGKPMPIVIAARGANLHNWSLSPKSNKPRFARIEVRYYDRKAGKWEKVERETGLDDVNIGGVGTYEAPSQEAAERKADALKKEMLRGLGEGRATIELNPFAQPEGTMVAVGTRLDTDGGYRIDGVDHTFNRSSGSTTAITVKSKIF